VTTERFTGVRRTTPLGPGDRAPSFALRRTFEETVDLDDLLGSGPVLLAFYVFDFGHF
jgi:peroxiredoxin